MPWIWLRQLPLIYDYECDYDHGHGYDIGCDVDHLQDFETCRGLGKDDGSNDDDENFDDNDNANIDVLGPLQSLNENFR